DGPYLYEGTWRMPPDVSRLEPWKGYAVRNLGTVPLTLKIPPKAADATLPAKMAIAENSDADWSIQIKARCEEARDEMNFLGWSPQATPEKDGVDFSEPPPIGEFVSLFFPHEDWSRYPGNYTNDFRPPAEDGEVWRARIETNIIARPVRVSWEGLEKLPSQFEALLVDHHAGVRLDLKKQDRYIFQSTKSLELLVVVGRKAFVENQTPSLVTLKEYALRQNYPNPFNPATLIRYQIPAHTAKPLQVQLRIFNTLGQLVRTLVESKPDVGFYEVIWDGKDNSGQLLPSGVYFYRLMAGDFQQTRKMTLLR
ncbi:MAG: FlgD immunoglobulin-like domain containing protein, partial [bacterium]